MMIRRNFCLASLSLLSACTLQQAVSGNEIAVGKISGQITEVLNGLNTLVMASSVQTILPATDLATAENSLSNARNVLTSLNGAPRIIALKTAQTWVTDLQTAANTIFDILEGKTTSDLPPTAAVIIEAIRVLMPIILTAVQILVTSATPTGLSAQQAETILKNPIIQ